MTTNTTEITYYEPRSKQVKTERMENAEDWRVQAFVVKLRREGKVIKDVKKVQQPVAEIIVEDFDKHQSRPFGGGDM
jgi:hypothetical protein